MRERRGKHASQSATIRSIGCSGETLRRWVRQAERENRGLRQADEILREASARFAAAELDRRSKT